MKTSSRAFWALTRASLKGYRRNPISAWGITLILALILVGARYLDLNAGLRLKLAVVDESRQPLAGQVVAALQGIPNFDVVETSASDANRLLDQGQTDLMVLIPPTLGIRDSSGRLKPATVTLRYRSGPVGESGAMLVRVALAEVSQAALGVAPVVGVRTEVIHQSTSVVADLFLPGLLAFNLVQSGLILATGIFAGYRASGVLRRIQATGVSATTFVFAHAAASALVGLSQIAILVGAALLVGGLTLRLVPLVAVSLLGYLVYLALGFAISAWIPDPERAPALATGLGLPLILLGLFPPGVFPGWLVPIVGALPVGFLTDAYRQVAQPGGTSLTADLLGLAAWSGALLLLASRVFRWD